MGELYPPTTADYAAAAARNASDAANKLEARIIRIEKLLNLPHELPGDKRHIESFISADGRKFFRIAGEDPTIWHTYK